ncbi:MAG TPA: Nudix family hydrolase, partial [Burkholderiales bacterium]|nr:Nudix family hydrolase [Burkholderiales bacterium]
MAEATTARRAIHVVAGVLIDGDRICITRRHDGAHQGGKWEFPGGKLEPNEDPFAGLQRELREELGIDVQQAAPFACVHHDYGDIAVTLDVWYVTRFDGAPRGREAQPLRWVGIADLDPSDFPDADRPILRRLQLPALYLLSDVGRFGPTDFTRRLTRALEAGARLVQLREPQMHRAEFVAYARQLAARCRDFGARLLVNADPAWVSECEADGVHLNSHRLLTLLRRPLAPEYWVGASCHDARELQAAQQLGVDFIVLGPVQPTQSHPHASALGWERFGALCTSSTLPIYAIGGMRPEDYLVARGAGAHGLAMIRGVWDRDDIE